MNKIESRSHQPRGDLCQTCTRWRADCSRLPFEEMVVIKNTTDGVKLVLCTQYERAVCLQPTDSAQKNVTANALSLTEQWYLDDKKVLSDALKEIYALRGEDKDIERIVLRALRNGNIQGY